MEKESLNQKIQFKQPFWQLTHDDFDPGHGDG
jgi:hypothetical protein